MPACLCCRLVALMVSVSLEMHTSSVYVEDRTGGSIRFDTVNQLQLSARARWSTMACPTTIVRCVLCVAQFASNFSIFFSFSCQFAGKTCYLKTCPPCSDKLPRLMGAVNASISDTPGNVRIWCYAICEKQRVEIMWN